jgi:hypothetical protein
MYRFLNRQQTIHIQANNQTHHHQLKLTAKTNTLSKQSWTLRYIATNSNIWLTGLVMICQIGNLPNFIPRVKRLTDSTKSIQTNQDHCQTPHEPTSLELSPNRGILSPLGFPLPFMFLISLSSHLPSLLICMAVRIMRYDTIEGFVCSCAAVLVKMFRLGARLVSWCGRRKCVYKRTCPPTILFPFPFLLT